MSHLHRPRLFECVHNSTLIQFLADVSSSFLGAGSEILIASVFEAAPPPTRSQRSGIATPPKASSLRPKDTAIPPGRKDFDSPLAKLYGKTTNRSVHPEVFQRREIGETGSSETTENDVEMMREELKALRESQLRMEEMFSKLLAGGGK